MRGARDHSHLLRLLRDKTENPLMGMPVPRHFLKNVLPLALYLLSRSLT